MVLTVAMALCGPSCMRENKSTTSINPTPKSTNQTRPIFDAVALSGKTTSEVARILGNPTDSWTPRHDPDGQMQSYSLGEDTTVEFHNNRIKSLVIFFSEKEVDSTTAYRLVGLDYSKPKPGGISNITIGSDWIKIFY